MEGQEAGQIRETRPLLNAFFLVPIILYLFSGPLISLKFLNTDCYFHLFESVILEFLLFGIVITTFLLYLVPVAFLIYCNFTISFEPPYPILTIPYLLIISLFFTSLFLLLFPTLTCHSFHFILDRQTDNSRKLFVVEKG